MTLAKRLVNLVLLGFVVGDAIAMLVLEFSIPALTAIQVWIKMWPVHLTAAGLAMVWMALCRGDRRAKG